MAPRAEARRHGTPPLPAGGAEHVRAGRCAGGDGGGEDPAAKKHPTSLRAACSLPPSSSASAARRMKMVADADSPQCGHMCRRRPVTCRARRPMGAARAGSAGAPRCSHVPPLRREWRRQGPPGPRWPSRRCTDCFTAAALPRHTQGHMCFCWNI